MQVIAVFALGAVTRSADPLPAVGAGAQVPLVQEVAGVALLAEALEPVLADEVVGAVREGVLVRAGGAQRAVAGAVGGAVGS